MAPEKSIWYRLGHAYERARLAGGSADEERRTGKALVARDARAPKKRSDAPSLPWPDADDLLGAAVWLLLDRVVGRGGRGRRAGPLRLIWAGASGAAAALLVDLVRPLLRADGKLPGLDEDTVDRMLAGLGQGLVYGALVEPRVPGPALLKGAMYGSVEFATDPAGGLSNLLSSHTPQGRLPVVGDLFAVRNAHDRAYLEHLVFGIALALLYESSPSSSGTRPGRAGDG